MKFYLKKFDYGKHKFDFVLLKRKKNISCEFKKDIKELILNRESYNDFFNNGKKMNILNLKKKENFLHLKKRNIKVLPYIFSDSSLMKLKLKQTFSNSQSNNTDITLGLNYNKSENDLIKSYSYQKDKISCFHIKNNISEKINFTNRFFKFPKNKIIMDNSSIISESILKNDIELQYDETKIFSKFDYSLKEHYEEFILNNINLLKEKNNKELIYFLIQEYNEKENNFVLKLKSIQIIFENIKTKKKKKLHFPFCYLPIFYYNDFQYFKYILLTLISFSNDFENISYDENKMLLFIKNSNLFKGKHKINDLKLNFNFNSLSINNVNYEKEINLKGDNYIFLWNTPKYTFKVKLILPLIQVIFLNSKNIIEHHVNSDLMCFLLENNFSNWGFYISKHLISFKLFRDFFENNLSKKVNLNSVLPNSKQSNNINIKHSILPLKIVDYIDLENLKKYFMYFETNNDLKNKISLIHGVQLEIIYFKKNFRFFFNFYQSKILSIISKFDDLRHFFLKIIKCNKENLILTIDYKFFSLFEEKDFKKIYNDKKKENINNENIKKDNEIIIEDNKKNEEDKNNESITSHSSNDESSNSNSKNMIKSVEDEIKILQLSGINISEKQKSSDDNTSNNNTPTKNLIGNNPMLREIEDYVQKNMDEMYKAFEELKASFQEEINEAEENGFTDIAEGLKEDLKVELDNLKDQYEEQRRVETEKIKAKYSKRNSVMIS
jgi:hypothetical protein